MLQYHFVNPQTVTMGKGSMINPWVSVNLHNRMIRAGKRTIKVRFFQWMQPNLYF